MHEYENVHTHTYYNLKMSRKCIKKYVNFSILVKKMK